jgi:hypothetical protein
MFTNYEVHVYETFFSLLFLFSLLDQNNENNQFTYSLPLRERARFTPTRRLEK